MCPLAAERHPVAAGSRSADRAAPATPASIGDQAMTDQNGTPEAILSAAYGAMAERYARALELADGLAEAFREPERGTERLRQICAVLDEVTAIERQVREARQRWDA